MGGDKGEGEGVRGDAGLDAVGLDWKEGVEKFAGRRMVNRESSRGGNNQDMDGAAYKDKVKNEKLQLSGMTPAMCFLLLKTTTSVKIRIGGSNSDANSSDSESGSSSKTCSRGLTATTLPPWPRLAPESALPRAHHAASLDQARRSLI